MCWCVLAFAHHLGALFSRRFCLPTDDFFSTPRTDALFSVQNRAREIVLTVKRGCSCEMYFSSRLGESSGHFISEKKNGLCEDVVWLQPVVEIRLGFCT